MPETANSGDKSSHLKPEHIVLGTGLAALVGAVVAYSFRYILPILLQPRLRIASRPMFHGEEETLESRALRIAAQDLLSGLELRQLSNGSLKRVLSAGRKHYREPWARDFSFASYGLLSLGEFEPVRETLEAFFAYQKEDGQLPVKLHSSSIGIRYLHSLLGREQPTFAPLRPKYLTGHSTISLDGQCLLLIAALRYTRVASDWEFVRTRWHVLRNALYWLEEHAHDEDGLLHQSAFSDWSDSVARSGKVLYTNVMYWKALNEMATAALRFGNTGEHASFESKAEQVAQAIEEHFWSEEHGYYLTSRIFDNLSSGGNLLAIAFGLADHEKAASILSVMERLRMDRPVPTRSAHRSYPFRSVALENHLGGLTSYHTGASWLWLGAWHVIAALEAGREAYAEELFRRMARVIVRDSEVHEVYGRTGRHISTFWYTSEAPLTWSAGMLVYAYQRLVQPSAHSA